MATDFVRDLSYALRGFARAPRVAAILLLTIGVGTGMNATVFSLVDALLFRAPAGVSHPSTLASIFTTQFSGYPYGPSSLPDVADMASRVPAFETVAAVDDTSTVDLRVGEGAFNVRAAAVSAQFFRTIGLTAERGSLLDGSETPVAAQPAVLSYGFWQDALKATDRAVGTTLTIDGRPYVVVGIAPDGFAGLQLNRRCDVWIPLTPTIASDDRRLRGLSVVARLKSTSHLIDAQRQLDALATQLASAHPDSNRGIVLQPAADRKFLARRYSRLDSAVQSRTTVIALLLFGATGTVFLCACASAGGLLLSRGSARKAELGIRLAVGATRGRLLRQLLTESLVISLCGGTVGLLLSRWTSTAFPSFFAPEQVALLDTSLDPGVFAFTMVLALLAAVLFGVAPATLSTSPAVVLALRSDPSGTSGAPGGARFRAVLVVAQVTLAVVLLAATLQLVHAFEAVLSTESSKTGHQIAIATVALPGGYVDEARSTRYLRAILTRARSVAGVEDAAWVSGLPLTSTNARKLRITHPESGVTEYAELPIVSTAGDYFAVMRIPLLAGRTFDDRDSGLSNSVVVVNDVFADRYYGAADLAIDQHLYDSFGKEAAIVGVVQSDWYRTLQPPPPATIYYPAIQQYTSDMNLVFRTGQASPAAQSSILMNIRELLLMTDGQATVRKLTTLDAHLGEVLAIERLTTVLVAACGVMTLGLALVGVYGVMADAVSRRTRELGVRLALGATASQIGSSIAADGVKLAARGALLGMALTLVVDRAIRWRVHEIVPLAPRTIATIAGLMAVMVALAGALPVMRALRVSPLAALRHE